MISLAYITRIKLNTNGLYPTPDFCISTDGEEMMPLMLHRWVIQRKLHKGYLPIRQQTPAKISLLCEEKQHLPFWNITIFTFQQATNPAVDMNLRICFSQLSGHV